MKKFAIIGFGGLGKLHFINLLKIQEKRGDIALTAICNSDLSAITKTTQLNIASASLDDIDFSVYNLYTDYKEMIDKEQLDFVFVTLPSHLHAEVCVYCLEHGLDVYTEKPMAITLKQCESMIAAAEKNNKKLMVGQCLRFSEEYIYIKELIENNTYGKVVKAEFSRKSPIPGWSFENWMLDEQKSGGCIVDMHIHDVDVMVWLFGTPRDFSVLCSHNMASYESAFALYEYDGFGVSIIGDWGIPSSYKFKSYYAVTFENAYVECINGCVTLYTNEEKKEITFSGENYLYREEVEFLEGVVDGKPFKTADIYSVYETMKLIFAEKEKRR
ncbi:MAG: Gfo/Idh/MocA family oxidoreductase [Clostridia bacterium]|nr:Gfo/Idh/MocA family oxidoreductase [Clostridia bacterium]